MQAHAGRPPVSSIPSRSAGNGISHTSAYAGSHGPDRYPPGQRKRERTPAVWATEGSRPPRRPPTPRKEPDRSQAFLSVPASWACGARLQSFVPATRTRHQFTLWPGEQINREAEQTEQKNHDHPHDRVVQPSCLGVLAYPNQEIDTERQEGDRDQDHDAATSRARGCGSGIIDLALRESTLSRRTD